MNSDIPIAGHVECQACRGEGMVTVIFVGMPTKVNCPTCWGMGSVPADERTPINEGFRRE